MSHPRHPGTDPDLITPAEREKMFDRPFWAVFLTTAIVGTAIWLAIFEHNYHPQIYRYSYEPSIGVQADPSKPGRSDHDVLAHPPEGVDFICSMC